MPRCQGLQGGAAVAVARSATGGGELVCGGGSGAMEVDVEDKA